MTKKLLDDIVRMIFSFVPTIQFYEWINNGTKQEQIQLLRLLPNSFIDEYYIVKSLFKSQNMDAIKCMVRNNNLIARCIIDCIDDLQPDILRDWLQYLREVKFESIGITFDKARHLKLHLPKLMPLFQSGLFEIDAKCKLKPDFVHQLKTTIPNFDYDWKETKLKRAMEACEWENAASLWDEKEPLALLSNIDTSMSPLEGFGVRTDPDDSWASTESNSNNVLDRSCCNYTTDDDRRCAGTKPSVRILNSVLSHVTTMEEHATTPFDTMLVHAVDEWKTKPWEERLWVFERSCRIGHVHIIRQIWDQTYEEHKRDRLRSCIANHSQYSDSKTHFDLVWEIAPQVVHERALEWMRFAFNFKRIKLWRFLHSKQFIQNDMLFDIQHNIWRKLASKPWYFLQTVWQTNDDWLQLVPELTNYALQKKNGCVIRFLCTKARIPNNILCERFLDFVKLRVHEAIAQITTTSLILLDDLHEAYEFAIQENLIDLVRTMLRVTPPTLLLDIATLVEMYPRSVGVFKLLLDANLISPRVLWDKTHHTLTWSEKQMLFSNIHFDLDNVDWGKDQLGYVLNRRYRGKNKTGPH